MKSLVNKWYLYNSELTQVTTDSHSWSYGCIWLGFSRVMDLRSFTFLTAPFAPGHYLTEPFGVQLTCVYLNGWQLHCREPEPAASPHTDETRKIWPNIQDHAKNLQTWRHESWTQVVWAERWCDVLYLAEFRHCRSRAWTTPALHLCYNKSITYTVMCVIRIAHFCGWKSRFGKNQELDNKTVTESGSFIGGHYGQSIFFNFNNLEWLKYQCSNFFFFFVQDDPNFNINCFHYYNNFTISVVQISVSILTSHSVLRTQILEPNEVLVLKYTKVPTCTCIHDNFHVYYVRKFFSKNIFRRNLKA